MSRRARGSRSLADSRPSTRDRAAGPEIVLLGALIADGAIGGATPAYCYGQDSGVVDTVEKAATEYGVRFQPCREQAPWKLLPKRRAAGSGQPGH